MGLSSLRRNWLKSYRIRGITQNNDICAIQGHRFWFRSKGHILICDFILLNNTNHILSCTVFKLLRIIDQIVAFDKRGIF